MPSVYGRDGCLAGDEAKRVNACGGVAINRFPRETDDRQQLRHVFYGAIEAAAQNRLDMLKVADCAKDPRLAAAS